MNLINEPTSYFNKDIKFMNKSLQFILIPSYLLIRGQFSFHFCLTKMEYQIKKTRFFAFIDCKTHYFQPNSISGLILNALIFLFTSSSQQSTFFFSALLCLRKTIANFVNIYPCI